MPTTRFRRLAFSVFAVSFASWGCGSSDDAPMLFAAENDGGGGGSNDGDGGTGDDDGGDDGGYDGTCETADDCDDGIPCTVDSCAFGACRHVPGPNDGATACPAGQTCQIGKGCVAGVVCADDDFCKERFKDDACKTNVRCNPATAVCEFSILDADGDGHAPLVCGGGDCNDADPLIFPGRAEACNGKDDNCNGGTDDNAVCPGGGVCQSGVCACPPANLCNGACVDYQTDAANCGGCGKPCDANASCDGGVCVPGGETCEPSALFVMQDISGSTADNGKLTAALEGIGNFVAAPSSSSVRMGLGFYPLPNPDAPPLYCSVEADCKGYGPCFSGFCIGGADVPADSCEVSDYASPAVPIAALPGNAAALQAALSGKNPTGGSPLSEPLAGAIQYARGWAQANPLFRASVVLVTDNLPNICSASMEAVVQTAEAGMAGSPAVRTYVIKLTGTDGTTEQWNGLAQAGGTSVARTVTTAMEMEQALEAIRVAASSCP